MSQPHQRSPFDHPTYPGSMAQHPPPPGPQVPSQVRPAPAQSISAPAHPTEASPQASSGRHIPSPLQPHPGWRYSFSDSYHSTFTPPITANQNLPSPGLVSTALPPPMTQVQYPPSHYGAWSVPTTSPPVLLSPTDNYFAPDTTPAYSRSMPSFDYRPGMMMPEYAHRTSARYSGPSQSNANSYSSVPYGGPESFSPHHTPLPLAPSHQYPRYTYPSPPSGYISETPRHMSSLHLYPGPPTPLYSSQTSLPSVRPSSSASSSSNSARRVPMTAMPRPSIGYSQSSASASASVPATPLTEEQKAAEEEAYLARRDTKERPPAHMLERERNGIDWKSMRMRDEGQQVVEELMRMSTKNLKSPTDAPKRPMNAFMIYMSIRRTQIAKAHPRNSNGENSRILAREWTWFMPDIDKQYWLDLADDYRDEFKRRFPSFQYRRTALPETASAAPLEADGSRKRRYSDPEPGLLLAAQIDDQRRVRPSNSRTLSSMDRLEPPSLPPSAGSGPYERHDHDPYLDPNNMGVGSNIYEQNQNTGWGLRYR